MNEASKINVEQTKKERIRYSFELFFMNIFGTKKLNTFLFHHEH